MNRADDRFKSHNSLYPDKWSVGMYLRLSDEDRDKSCKLEESKSIVNQREYLNYAREVLTRGVSDENTQGDLVIFKEYIDDDVSGMTFDRKGFAEMMQDVRDNKIDCILVKDFSRFGRDNVIVEKYLEDIFEQAGKEIRFIAFGDNYDSLVKTPDIGVRIILTINREYSENQSHKVKTIMHSMQRSGKAIGAFAPYGYIKEPENKHHFIIDQLAAEVVKKIYKRYIDGLCPKEIARELTQENMVSPSAYKQQSGSKFVCCHKISEKEVYWTSAAVKHILMNESYTGTLVQHKQVKKRLKDKNPTMIPKNEWIRVENAHEAIIDKQDWLRAQSMMETVKRDVTKEDSITIFKGILKCGDCNHAMRKKWDKYKENKYLYYNCGTFRDYGLSKKNEDDNMPKCTSHYISDAVIRSIVINDFNTILASIEKLDETSKKYSVAEQDMFLKLNLEIKEKERAVKLVKRRLSVATNKWLDEQLTDGEYSEIKNEVTESARRLENDIVFLEKAKKTSVNTAEHPWIKRLLEIGKIEELDRATVVNLLDKIYVYKNKTVKMVYHFSGELDDLFRTVTDGS